MIIGFFGKGGSGKTTTSFRFIQAMAQHRSLILAIDADHNLDLAYNLKATEPISYIGHVVEDQRLFSITQTHNLFPKDSVTETYTQPVAENILLMVAGPHIEAIFQGDMCSHGLLKPVISYLKQLRVKESELVVVDATAGMDAVGVGIPHCLDVAAICVEPTVDSLKVGRQIAEGLAYLGTPAIIAANKIQTQIQLEQVQQAFQDRKIVSIPSQPKFTDPGYVLDDQEQESFQRLYSAATHIVTGK